MKFKDAFIVPIIGFGCFDEILTIGKTKWRIRTIIILCVKIQFYEKTIEK